MMKDVPLDVFWGSSDLRLVVYTNGAGGGEHRVADNSYLMCVQSECPPRAPRVNTATCEHRHV